jgi:hypothetical protein
MAGIGVAVHELFIGVEDRLAIRSPSEIAEIG